MNALYLDAYKARYDRIIEECEIYAKEGKNKIYMYFESDELEPLEKMLKNNGFTILPGGKTLDETVVVRIGW